MSLDLIWSYIELQEDGNIRSKTLEKSIELPTGDTCLVVQHRWNGKIEAVKDDNHHWLNYLAGYVHFANSDALQVSHKDLAMFEDLPKDSLITVQGGITYSEPAPDFRSWVVGFDYAHSWNAGTESVKGAMEETVLLALQYQRLSKFLIRGGTRDSWEEKLKEWREEAKEIVENG